MTDGIVGVPTWVQTVIATGFFFGTMIAGYRGYIKAHQSDAAKDHHSSDTVVISAALADGRVIRDLTESVRSFAEYTKDTLSLAARDHDMLDRICVTVERMSAGIDRHNDLTQRLLDEIRACKNARTGEPDVRTSRRT